MEQRNIDDPDETRPYAAHGHMDVVTVGEFTLGRGIFKPGWQWSKDVKTDRRHRLVHGPTHRYLRVRQDDYPQ